MLNIYNDLLNLIKCYKSYFNLYAIFKKLIIFAIYQIYIIQKL